MNRKEFVSRVAVALRQAGAKKTVTLPKHVFHISDDEGNQRDFVVKGTTKDKLYTVEDIDAMLDGCIRVLLDAMRSGETVSIHGFGKLWIKLRKGRGTRLMNEGNLIAVPPRFVAAFTPGKDTKLAVRRHQLDLEDQGLFPPPDSNGVSYPDEEGDD